jgi:hypothetical protein
VAQPCWVQNYCGFTRLWVVSPLRFAICDLRLVFLLTNLNREVQQSLLNLART